MESDGDFFLEIREFISIVGVIYRVKKMKFHVVKCWKKNLEFQNPLRGHFLSGISPTVHPSFVIDNVRLGYLFLFFILFLFYLYFLKRKNKQANKQRSNEKNTFARKKEKNKQTKTNKQTNNFSHQRWGKVSITSNLTCGFDKHVEWSRWVWSSISSPNKMPQCLHMWHSIFLFVVTLSDSGSSIPEWMVKEEKPYKPDIPNNNDQNKKKKKKKKKKLKKEKTNKQTNKQTNKKQRNNVFFLIFKQSPVKLL